jgi:hypothetical protein
LWVEIITLPGSLLWDTVEKWKSSERNIFSLSESVVTFGPELTYTTIHDNGQASLKQFLTIDMC